MSGSVTAHGITVPAEPGRRARTKPTGPVPRRPPAWTAPVFGVSAKKGMVGRTADVVIEAAARPAGANPAEAMPA